MSNFKNSTFQEVIFILGRADYVSAVQRAEDIVDLFAAIPMARHIGIIVFILSSRKDYRIPEDVEIAKKTYRVTDEDVSQVHSSDYVRQFLMDVYRAMGRGSLEEMAVVISSYVNKAPTFAHRVAIFSDVVADLRTCVLVQGSKLQF